MLSNYELRMLGKLGHKHSIEKAKNIRVAQSVKKQATTTKVNYRQIVVREERPCHC